MRLMHTSELRGGLGPFGALAAGIPGYEADQQTLRIWIKLFAVTPEQLPSNLREDIMSWLSRAPLSVMSTCSIPAYCLTIF
jgi:hypothetical protein